MAQYIDKDALVAEIKRILLIYTKHYDELAKYEVWGTAKEIEYRIQGLKEALSILDTIEVKEVNFETELDEWMKYGPHTNYPWCTIPDAIKITAEHFFELGLKTQKGE